jgi:hypothetical protein
MAMEYIANFEDIIIFLVITTTTTNTISVQKLHFNIPVNVIKTLKISPFFFK